MVPAVSSQNNTGEPNWPKAYLTPVDLPDVILNGVARCECLSLSGNPRRLLSQPRSWACADKEDFHNHTRFFEQAAAGTLPAFSWIMPPAPMMDHPCHDIALGERLHKDM